MAARPIAVDRDQMHAKLDGTVRLLNGLRMQVALKRMNGFFNPFLALGASITSICHERCRLLVERERVHLERQLVSLDYQISSLRKLDAELMGVSRCDATNEDSDALRLFSNTEVTSEAASSSAFTEADLERELDDISRRATGSCILDAFEPNEAPLRATLSNFFDGLQDNLDRFYEARVLTLGNHQSHVAPSSNTSGANSVAVSSLGSKTQTKRKNDESKRKANSALESITNAARIAKKCRQVPPVITVPPASQVSCPSQTLLTSDSFAAASQASNASPLWPVQLEAQETRTVVLSTASAAHLIQPHGDGPAEMASFKDAEPTADIAEACGAYCEYCEPTPPRVGDTFECYMQHFETLDEFYVVKRADHEHFTPIINQAIEQLLANRDETLCESEEDDPIVGAAYVTQFDDDLRWYRTTVTRVDKVSQRATVRFVDFGNERTLPLPGTGWCLDRKLLRVHQRHAPSELLQTPTQVLRCALAGVKLCKSSDSTNDLFETIYAQLLDVLLVARVLNVRRIFTVPSGGFLPTECDGFGNPFVCDVLLCFADCLKPESDRDHETMLQSSVQTHFVQMQPPLLQYVDGGPKLDVCRSIRSPLLAGTQSHNDMRTVSPSTLKNSKTHCIEMGVPVYITCVETPNAIYVVRRNPETVESIIDLHKKLVSFVQTYLALERDDTGRNCSNTCPTDQSIKQARKYLLDLYSREFDSIQRTEYSDDNPGAEYADLGAKWHADAPKWKHLALPCLWQSASNVSGSARWLRGLLVEVDFVRNTMAIVCVDYGGTAREPLQTATSSPFAIMPLSMRLLRLPPQFAFQAVPPFATCVCLADLISVGMKFPHCTYNGTHSQLVGINSPTSLASVHETYVNVAWITKAVESLNHVVFINPDWAGAKQFGDHLPVVVHADGSLDDINEHAVAAASSSYKVDGNVLEDELAQNAVYLRIPSNSVFNDLEEYETVKQDLAKWLLAGCAAPLPLDGAARLAFRWPKAGVNLLIKKRSANVPLSEPAPQSSNSDNLESDSINLGNHLVSTGLASRLALEYSA